MEITEKDYAYWLFNVPGIGNRSVEKLLVTGLSCREIYEMSPKDLKHLLTEKQVKNIENSRYYWNFDREKKKLSGSGIRFISRIDEDFPEKLKNIPDAPFAIYVKGRLPDPSVPSVSIVGARMCSDYGRYMARLFGRGLALAGVQVISGMARGVDSIAQAAALSVNGSSFGILGCGVDICYPPENGDVYDALAKNGGLISEYPPGTMPEARLFPARNRIISALSDVLLVVEARQRSGTSITVETALEQGKEVLTVPGRATDRLSDGCNHLIRDGAGVAACVEDVLERLSGLKIRYCAASESNENNPNTSYKTADLAVRDSQRIVIDINGTENDNVSPKNEPDAEGDEMSPLRELSMEDEIMQIVDIIPVSTSFILEELSKKGKNISVPVLLSTLMDMTYTGKIAQDGAYYRKIA